MINRVLGLGVCFLVTVAAQAGTITLGSFNFNDQQFGNTLTESDGGTFRASNWLNIVNANPGNPGALTGANFNTGIANMDIDGNTVDYTIGYSTPIVNTAGNDFALVVGYSFASDIYHVAVSTDGSTFTTFHDFAGSTGTDTGVSRSFYYGGGGPFGTDLIVLPIDLTSFGIGSGASVAAIRIEGRAGEQDDYIRIAGLNASTTGVPEPISITLVGLGLGGLALLRRAGNTNRPV